MSKKLSKQTVAFHWVIGLLFMGVLFFGLYVAGMSPAPEKWALLGTHKSLGVIVLVIAIARIAWRIKEGSLPAISKVSRFQEKLAKGIHHLLLTGTLAMPISGLMMSIGGGRAVSVFGLEIYASGDKTAWLSAAGHMVHEFGGSIIIAALALHVLGALKHQFVDKDGTISRMLGK